MRANRAITDPSRLLLFPGILMSATLALVACADVNDARAPEPSSLIPPDAVPVDEGTARKLLPENWLGDELGLPPPRAYRLGPVRVDTEEVFREQPPFGHGSSESRGAFTDPVSLVTFFEGHEYMIILEHSPEMEALAERRAREELRAIAGQLPLWGAESDELVDKGVVGTDGRVRRGIADGQQEEFWLSAIGRITRARAYSSTLCTGALIASDLVLTAAHCVLDWDASIRRAIPRELVFHPRSDNTVRNQEYPWGHWPLRLETAAVFVASGWHTFSCSAKPTAACRPHDWAIVRVTRPAAAAAHRAYMAVAALETSQMRNLKNRGYPICSTMMNGRSVLRNDAPAQCRERTLYGDRGVCRIEKQLGNDRGFATTVSHACDTSLGHSGGPLYDYFDGIPTIAGIHVSDPSEWAFTDSYNWMRRITPEVVAVVQRMRH